MSSEASKFGAIPGRRARRATLSFFFIAHLVLLLAVLVGFSPSFYLRAAFHDVTQLPALVYVHGAVLTVWFLLTVLEGWLIRRQKLRLHRQLGYAAAGYAAIVIVLGILANLMLIADIESPADGRNVVVWANFFSLGLFAAFVSLAVVFRRKPEAHKRLMLLASMSIVSPALARIPAWPLFPGGPAAGRIYAIAGLLLMFAALLMYDMVTRGKPHPASWVGVLVILASIAGAFFFGVTGIGYRLLNG